MDSLKIKFRKILLPLFLTSGAAIVAYTFVYWVLHAKVGIKIRIYDDNYFYFILAYSIPISIYLFKKIRILEYGYFYRSGLYTYFIILMVASMALPIAFMHDYVKSDYYDLVEIDNPDDLISLKDEKYFKINNIVVNKDLCLSSEPKIHVRKDKRSRGGEETYYEYGLMIVCKVDNSENIWVGFVFKDEYREGLFFKGDIELKVNLGYTQFLIDSVGWFDEVDLRNAKYYERYTSYYTVNRLYSLLEDNLIFHDKKSLYFIKPGEVDFEIRNDVIINKSIFMFFFVLLLYFPVIIFSMVRLNPDN